MPTKSVLTIAMSALLVLSASHAFAEAKTKKVKASREQVAAACEASDGLGWGYGADSGSYGCMTDNAWIDCDENGDCEGSTAKKTAVSRKTFHLSTGGVMKR